MTIEEKARAYDEALKRARKLQENSNGMILKKWLWNIFPELKESENERIRTGLINGFKECLKNSQYSKNAQKYWHNIKIEDILAWLEKQGEQKPAWSEEDDYYRDNLIKWLNCGAVRVDLRKDFIDWLESLKQRMEE